MKKCTKCQIEKECTDFQVRSASKDGFTARCKQCLSDYDKSRANNSSRVRARKEYQKTDAYKESARRASRKYARDNKEKRKESVDKYREKNKKKYQCHGIVAYAIKCGNLVRNHCEVCYSAKTHAHHDDYDKPLDVRWLCDKHHNEWHRINGEGKNAN
ncbi:endonuclease [Vibrio phage K24]|nr:hypothetical protein SIPHO078v2_p0055 [Vibrio phage 14E30.1]